MKLLKTTFLVAILATLHYAGSFAMNNKFISVKGPHMIDTKGNPFVMKGINIGNWLVPEGYMFHFKETNAPRQINETINELIGPAEAKLFWQKYLDNYITEADIQYLKSTGINSIRLPFHYKLFTNEDYLGSNDENRGFRYMDSIIRWCSKAGIFVLLDMHCAPGGQTGDNIDDSYGYPFLFGNEHNESQTAAIWTRIAARYKDEPAIIGYDLLNEPIAHYFDASKINPFLEPLYKRLVKAIRSTDNNHLLFLGGAQWDGNFKVFNKPFDDKVVYTFHKYWSDTTVAVIQEYLDFRNKFQVPVYMGESGENTDEWITSFRTLMDNNNIGWHFWPYKKMDSPRCMITFALPEGFQSIIDYAEASRTSFEKIRHWAPADRDKIKMILYKMVENSNYLNCTTNQGYVKALGLSMVSASTK